MSDEAREEYMLTTVDNPYDPFTQFIQWNAYDMKLGHYTAGFLARLVVTSDDLSDADQFMIIQDAIHEIVQENVLGVFRKVKRGQIKKENNIN